MPRKTYNEISKELLSKKKSNENLKKRISSLREEMLRYKTLANSLSTQYERIIKEWKKMYQDLVNNGWKIVFVKVVEKINKLKGGGK